MYLKVCSCCWKKLDLFEDFSVDAVPFHGYRHRRKMTGKHKYVYTTYISQLRPWDYKKFEM